VTFNSFQQQLHPSLLPTTVRPPPHTSVQYQEQVKHHTHIYAHNQFQVYGYDGSYPGATFEAKVNRPVEVTWTNDLPLHHILPTVPLEGSAWLAYNLSLQVVWSCLLLAGPNFRIVHSGETPPESGGVVHLHGGHTPADSDGNPLDFIVKGQQQHFRYPNRQLATTLWYHDHIWTRNRANVVAGLAGMATSELSNTFLL
jgi:spore coat protein A